MMKVTHHSPEDRKEGSDCLDQVATVYLYVLPLVYVQLPQVVLHQPRRKAVCQYYSCPRPNHSSEKANQGPYESS